MSEQEKCPKWNPATRETAGYLDGDEPQATIADLRRQLADAKAVIRKQSAAIDAALELDDPCWFDHHGLCQAHNLRRNAAGEPECQMKLLRAAAEAAKEQT